MKKISLSLVVSLFSFLCSYSQSVTDIVNAVNLDSLSLTVKEFSGEVSTSVGGNTVTLLNREYGDNNLAAEYIYERLNRLENTTVAYQFIADDDGRRNVIATQLGTVYPEKTYIICGHYDAGANYCADDNASGVATIIETARLLAGQCKENTIIYAFWDEEEIGLKGSKYYAELAQTNGDAILGVYNIDMIGYDGDDDESFDIDVKQGDADSLSMSDDIVAVLNSYPFNLNVNIVNPGTEYSDHSSFWNRGYPAVLVGEAWSENDENAEYHSDNDRFNLFNLDYYHELSKLSAGYIATKAVLIDLDNSVTQNETSLIASQGVSITYQWYNCASNTTITGATFQTYMPAENGSYRVEITSGSCTEFSDCYVFSALGLPTFTDLELQIFPNPVQLQLTVQRSKKGEANFTMYDVSGEQVYKMTSKEKITELQLHDLAKGVYFLSVESSKKRGVYKIVKD